MMAGPALAGMSYRHPSLRAKLALEAMQVESERVAALEVLVDVAARGQGLHALLDRRHELGGCGLVVVRTGRVALVVVRGLRFRLLLPVGGSPAGDACGPTA